MAELQATSTGKLNLTNRYFLNQKKKKLSAKTTFKLSLINCMDILYIKKALLGMTI